MLEIKGSPPLPAPSRSERSSLYARLCDRMEMRAVQGDDAALNSEVAAERVTGMPGVCGQPSFLVGGSLRRYQIEGIDWLFKAWSTGRSAMTSSAVSSERSMAD